MWEYKIELIISKWRLLQNSCQHVSYCSRSPNGSQTLECELRSYSTLYIAKVEKSFERENLKQQQSQFVLGDKTGSNSWHYCCQCYPDLSRWWNHFISYYLGHAGWATHFLNTVFIFEIVSVSRVELGLTAFTLFLLSRPTTVLFILKVLLKRFWVLDKNARFGALSNPKKWLLERVWKYGRGRLWRTTQLNLFLIKFAPNLYLGWTYTHEKIFIISFIQPLFFA